MIKLILTEEEKNNILNQHRAYGYGNPLNESSLVIPTITDTNTQFIDSVLDSLPSITKNPENFCVNDELSEQRVDGQLMTNLNKVLGKDSQLFITKFNQYIDTNKSSGQNIIKTLKGFLKNPAQGFEQLKSMIGFKSQTNEQVGIGAIAAAAGVSTTIATVGVGVIVLIIGFLIIKIVIRIFEPKSARNHSKQGHCGRNRRQQYNRRR
jgi:hypothetical protein